MDDVLAQPVGCGPTNETFGQGRRPPLTPVGAYMVAMIVGSSLSSGLIFAIGIAARRLAEPSFVWTAAGAIAGIATILQAAGRVTPLPERRAQVPRRWITWRKKAASAAAFGFVLGTSFFTLLHHASIYVLAVLIALAPSLGSGLAIGAVYGSARALLVVGAWAMNGRSVMDFLPRRPIVNRILAMTCTTTFAGAAALMLTSY